MKLPGYLHINFKNLQPASILLFYNGNKATEFIGKYIYKHKYNPPAFHAALYVGGSKFKYLNVGRFVTLEKLSDDFRSTRRIDVITYPLSPLQQAETIERGMKDLGKFYDVKGFLHFGRKIPLIGNLFKPLKPSERLPFCSDSVVDAYNAISYRVSFRDDENTAPWDLLEYAENTDANLRTVWQGKDFPYAESRY